MSPRATPRILIGPRSLDDRICRLMYMSETDEAWAEEWAEREWVRTTVLVRYLMKAPVASKAVLVRRGIPREVGEWDVERIH
jgi:hypothetical protein